MYLLDNNNMVEGDATSQLTMDTRTTRVRSFWSSWAENGTTIVLLLLLVILLSVPCHAAPQVVFVDGNHVEGDRCGDTGIPGSGPGVCTKLTQCPAVRGLLTPVRCGYGQGNIFCCPQTVASSTLDLGTPEVSNAIDSDLEFGLFPSIHPTNGRVLQKIPFNLNFQ
ncbi:unnamed protein product [Meganyctiphanes norvegica]|uniref:Uncharacterized protein n=1 Tax=Meganyctiphanes norvegica TaxID=48144 RepID=A0AAV2Q5G9_MEGNR